MRRILVVTAVALLAVLILIEVFVYSPTMAAIIAAALLALADYYRRRGGWL